MPNIAIEPRFLHKFCLVQHMPFQAVEAELPKVCIAMQKKKRRQEQAINECED